MNNDRSKNSGPGAFVAGATGYTGLAVVRKLAEDGVETIAHVRPDSPELDERKSRFAGFGAQTDATAWRLDSMTDTLARLRPEVVFCCIGTTMKRKRRLKKAGGDPEQATHEAVDYGLTALIAQAARDSGVAPRFVYVSAIGAGPKATGSYMKARYKAEQAVIDSGLPYVIARPAFIAGSDREEKRPLEHFGASALDGVLAAAAGVGLGKLQKRYRSINAEGLASALVKLGFDPKAENRIVEHAELLEVAG